MLQGLVFMQSRRGLNFFSLEFELFQFVVVLGTVGPYLIF